MIVTTSDTIPQTNVQELIGIVHGIAVEPRTRQEQADPKDPQKFSVNQSQLLEEARNIATKRMLDYAKFYKADAIIGVKYEITTSPEGYIQVFAYGTAVKLDNIPDFYAKRAKSKAKFTPETEAATTATASETPRANTAETEVGVSISAMEDKDEDRDTVVNQFIKELDIDRKRAVSLYEAGFTSMTKLNKATIKELLAVEGVNPTMARVIKGKLQ